MHDETAAARGPAASRRSMLAGAAAGLLALVGSRRPAAAAGPERPDSGSGDGEITEGVDGELVDRNGKPLAGVLITPSADGRGAGAVPEMAVQTDAAGKFRWPLGPGRYRLDAIAEGRVIATLRVSVAPRRLTKARLTAAGAR